VEIATLVIALMALVAALKKPSGGNSKAALEELDKDGRRRLENLAKELRGELETTRRLLAELAAGRPLDPDQVIEGRLWRDLDARAAERLFAAGGLHVLDVRTPQEVAAGKLPGALHIPIQELEERVRELPKDGRPTLVYCAAGSRSAAACEFLSTQGFSGLHNLAGGISAWGGPVERAR
jgi:rhodanese-related sulfurtransferase